MLQEDYEYLRLVAQKYFFLLELPTVTIHFKYPSMTNDIQKKHISFFWMFRSGLRRLKM